MDMTNVSNWVVLAVDDEPDSLEVLVEVLTMYDASIHAVSSGQEVLEKLSTVCPNLVITDLSMPGMDGYQLLYRIRHTEGYETVPIIALTAHAMSGDREHILAAGFTGYVSKPLRIANLASDILAMLAIPEPAAPKPDGTSQPSPESTPVGPDAEPHLPQPVSAVADAVSHPPLAPIPIASPESTPVRPDAEPHSAAPVPAAADAVSHPPLVSPPISSDNGTQPSPESPLA